MLNKINLHFSSS